MRKLVITESHLDANALRTLQARYLRTDEFGRLIKNPEQLFQRVARCISHGERAQGASQSAIKKSENVFYKMMICGKFLPNSPTLMNANRAMGMLSACFVLPIEDSIEGIFDSVKHTAQIQKAGCGTGFSFDHLRPTGDYISSSEGRTSGPISFLKVFCEATRAIQQGAFRRAVKIAWKIGRESVSWLHLVHYPGL